MDVFEARKYKYDSVRVARVAGRMRDFRVRLSDSCRWKDPRVSRLEGANGDALPGGGLKREGRRPVVDITVFEYQIYILVNV